MISSKLYRRFLFTVQDSYDILQKLAEFVKEQMLLDKDLDQKEFITRQQTGVDIDFNNDPKEIDRLGQSIMTYTLQVMAQEASKAPLKLEGSGTSSHKAGHDKELPEDLDSPDDEYTNSTTYVQLKLACQTLATDIVQKFFTQDRKLVKGKYDQDSVKRPLSAFIMHEMYPSGYSDIILKNNKDKNTEMSICSHTENCNDCFALICETKKLNESLKKKEKEIVKGDKLFAEFAKKTFERSDKTVHQKDFLSKVEKFVSRNWQSIKKNYAGYKKEHTSSEKART